MAEGGDPPKRPIRPPIVDTQISAQLDQYTGELTMNFIRRLPPLKYVSLELIRHGENYLGKDFKVEIVLRRNPHVGMLETYVAVLIGPRESLRFEITFGVEECIPENDIPKIFIYTSANSTSETYSVCTVEQLVAYLSTNQLHYDFTSLKFIMKLKIVPLLPRMVLDVNEPFRIPAVNDPDCDHTLLYRGITIRVHSRILLEGSQFFRRHFARYPDISSTHFDMFRRAEKRLERDVLECILRFMYARPISSHNLRSPRLLSAAREFEINELFELCEREMLNYLSADAGPELFHIGEAEGARSLRDETARYLIQHFPIVLRRWEWPAFREAFSKYFQPAIPNPLNYFRGVLGINHQSHSAGEFMGATFMVRQPLVIPRRAQQNVRRVEPDIETASGFSDNTSKLSCESLSMDIEQSSSIDFQPRKRSSPVTGKNRPGLDSLKLRVKSFDDVPEQKFSRMDMKARLLADEKEVDRSESDEEGASEASSVSEITSSFEGIRMGPGPLKLAPPMYETTDPSTESESTQPIRMGPGPLKIAPPMYETTDPSTESESTQPIQMEPRPIQRKPMACIYESTESEPTETEPAYNTGDDVASIPTDTEPVYNTGDDVSSIPTDSSNTTDYARTTSSSSFEGIRMGPGPLKIAPPMYETTDPSTESESTQPIQMEQRPLKLAPAMYETTDPSTESESTQPIQMGPGPLKPAPPMYVTTDPSTESESTQPIQMKPRPLKRKPMVCIYESTESEPTETEPAYNTGDDVSSIPTDSSNTTDYARTTSSSSFEGIRMGPGPLKIAPPMYETTDPSTESESTQPIQMEHRPLKLAPAMYETTDPSTESESTQPIQMGPGPLKPAPPMYVTTDPSTESESTQPIQMEPRPIQRKPMAWIYDSTESEPTETEPSYNTGDDLSPILTDSARTTTTTLSDDSSITTVDTPSSSSIEPQSYDSSKPHSRKEKRQKKIEDKNKQFKGSDLPVVEESTVYIPRPTFTKELPKDKSQSHKFKQKTPASTIGLSSGSSSPSSGSSLPSSTSSPSEHPPHPKTVTFGDVVFKSRTPSSDELTTPDEEVVHNYESWISKAAEDTSPPDQTSENVQVRSESVEKAWDEKVEVELTADLQQTIEQQNRNRFRSEEPSTSSESTSGHSRPNLGGGVIRKEPTRFRKKAQSFDYMPLSSSESAVTTSSSTSSSENRKPEQILLDPSAIGAALSKVKEASERFMKKAASIDDDEPLSSSESAETTSSSTSDGFTIERAIESVEATFSSGRQSFYRFHTERLRSASSSSQSQSGFQQSSNTEAPGGSVESQDSINEPSTQEPIIEIFKDIGGEKIVKKKPRGGKNGSKKDKK